MAVMHKCHSSATGHGKSYLQMIFQQPLFVPEGSFVPPCCCCWGERRVWLREGACRVALHCSAAPGDTAPLRPPHGHLTGFPPVLAVVEGTAHCKQCAWGFALPPVACANRRPNRQAGHLACGWRWSHHSALADLQMGWQYFSWILLPY